MSVHLETSVKDIRPIKTMVLIGERYAIDWDQEKVPPLGKGSFGVVFKVLDVHFNEDVAVKRMPAVYNSFDDTKRVLRELRLLRLMRHDSILGIHDAFIEPNEKDAIYFTTPMFDSDLSVTTKKVEMYKRIASPSILISIMRQILEGIQYLHEIGVIHRDIKPANILIDMCTVRIKICDFGLARMLPFTSPHSKSKTPLTEYVNTRWYRAPEVTLSNGQYGFEQDVWATACTFVDLIFRQPLFPGKSCLKQLTLIILMLGTPEQPEELGFTMTVPAMRYLCSLPSTKGSGIESFTKSKWASLIVDFSKSFQDYFLVLITEMLAFDPQHRITSTAALTSSLFHPSFSNSNCYPVDVVPAKQDIQVGAFDFRDIERCSIAQYPANMKQLIRQEVSLINSRFVSSSSGGASCNSPNSIVTLSSPPSLSPTKKKQQRPRVWLPFNPSQPATILENSPEEDCTPEGTCFSVDSPTLSDVSPIPRATQLNSLGPALLKSLECSTEHDDVDEPKEVCKPARSRNLLTIDTSHEILDSDLTSSQDANFSVENFEASYSSGNQSSYKEHGLSSVFLSPQNPSDCENSSEKEKEKEKEGQRRRRLSDFFSTVTNAVFSRGTSTIFRMEQTNNNDGDIKNYLTSSSSDSTETSLSNARVEHSNKK